MQLLRSIHDALRRHLPSMHNEKDRHEALAYLRGLETILGAKPGTAKSNVIWTGNDQTRRRIERTIKTTQGRQTADALRLHQLALDEFFWHDQNDFD